jgi:hypothetical protein
MESAMAKAEELNQKVKEMDKELETLRSRYLDGEQIYDQLNQKILTYKIDILYLQYYIDNSSKTEEESLMIKQMYDEIKADMETLLGDIKEFIVSLG